MTSKNENPKILLTSTDGTLRIVGYIKENGYFSYVLEVKDHDSMGDPRWSEKGDDYLEDTLEEVYLRM